MLYTIIIILPFLIAIALIIWKQEPILPILLGIFLSLWILYKFNPVAGYVNLTNYILIHTLTDPNTWSIVILFSEVLVLYHFFSSKGVFQSALNSKILKKFSRYTVELIALLLNTVLTFEEFLSVLFTSLLFKPFIKKKNLRPERFSFTVSNLSPSLFTLIPFTLFLPVVVPLIGNTLTGLGIDYPPIKIIIRSIPFQFYNIFTLFIIAATTILKKDAHIFRKKIAIEAREKLVIVQNPRSTRSKGDDSKFSLYAGGGSIIIVLTTLILIAVIFLPNLGSLSRINRQNIEGLLSSAVLGGIIYFILYMIISKKDNSQNIVLKNNGQNCAFFPITLYLILSLAVSITAKRVSLGKQLTELIISSNTKLNLYPLLFFIISVILSYISGSRLVAVTSLIPIALKGLSTAHTDPLIVDYFTYATVGAIISGSTFGVINSVFSPVFIVVTGASELSIKSRVLLQLPYTILATVTSLLFGYLFTYMKINPIFSIIVGILVIGSLFVFLKRITTSY